MLIKVLLTNFIETNPPDSRDHPPVHMAFDTALTGFNLGQFKRRMKKMAAQVDFCLSLNASPVPENWHCVFNKGPAYLLTYISVPVAYLAE